MKIAVIGAGIAGLLPAYMLARQGHDVTVYDQERYPAMRTSYANGGQVSVSNSEVWTTWNNVIKGVKWMFTKDAPLLIRPSLDWDKAIWLSKFLYNTARNIYERNTAETIKLGLESRQLYQEIIKKERLQFDQTDCGILHFYKDKKYFDKAVQAEGIYSQNGVEWQILNPKEIIKLEPNLKNCRDIVGGAWTPSDWTGDIHKFCLALSKAMINKYKVKFMFNDFIEDVRELSGYYDKVIIAAGVGSKKLADQLGDPCDIYPVKGYSITIDLGNSGVKNVPKVSLLDDQAKIVTSTLGNRLRVAGTAELAGENYDIRRDRIEPLLNWVHTNFPKIDTSNYSSWACLRPMTANMMPMVRASKHKNIYYHTGHGHLGWTLSPATSQRLVELIGLE